MFAKNQSFYVDFHKKAMFPVEPVPANEWKSGLMVRSPNWLGDAVMILPALRQLRKILPAACRLTVVCPQAFQSLFQALDCVDDVIGLQDPHVFFQKDEKEKIRTVHPDICLLFTNSFRDALAFRLAGVRRMRGASARFRSLLLERAYRFPPRRDRVLNAPHQALKYLFIAYTLGAPEWDGTLPVIRPEAAPSKTIEPFLDQKDQHLLLIAPGAAYGDAKRWDPEHFRKVVQWWIGQGGKAVALGSRKERPGAGQALAGLPPDQVWNLAGETSLTDLLILFRHAELCIANDSGLMHLAAVSGLKGIAPFGPTDPAATSPLSKDWILLYDKQDCAPCFRRVCPEGTKRCLNAITPERVIEAARALTGKP